MDRNLLLCSALLDSQLSFPTHSSTYGHTRNKHTQTYTPATHTHTVNVAEVINNFYVFTFQVKFISRFCYGCCALWISCSASASFAPSFAVAASPVSAAAAAAFSYMTTIYDHPWAIYITAWQHSYLAWQGVWAATKYLGLKHLTAVESCLAHFKIEFNCETQQKSFQILLPFSIPLPLPSPLHRQVLKSLLHFWSASHCRLTSNTCRQSGSRVVGRGKGGVADRCANCILSQMKKKRWAAPTFACFGYARKWLKINNLPLFCAHKQICCALPSAIPPPPRVLPRSFLRPRQASSNSCCKWQPLKVRA